MTKYIQGDDGKFAGSIGDGKGKTPTEIPAAPLPNPYAEALNSLDKANELEKEINDTLSEGLAEVSKAFSALEDYYRARIARREQAAAEYEKFKAESDARLAKIQEDLEIELARIRDEETARKARFNRWFGWIPGLRIK
jgi:hypothetical protein